jgi:hypothetical protein
VASLFKARNEDVLAADIVVQGSCGAKGSSQRFKWQLAGRTRRVARRAMEQGEMEISAEGQMVGRTARAED